MMIDKNIDALLKRLHEKAIEYDEYDISGGEVDYIYVVLDDETRKIIEALGIDLSEYEYCIQEYDDGEFEIDISPFVFQFADWWNIKNGFGREGE